MDILLVEDNKEIASNIKQYIELKTNNSWKIDIAYTGKEAIEKISDNNYDLLLLDIMLPDISGYEIAKIVKNNLDIPIIFITAKSMLEDKLK